jgi:DNA-binding NarL/FixJ family response regulator
MTVVELPAPPPAVGVVQAVIIDRHRLFARGLQAALEDASAGRVVVLAHDDRVGQLGDLIRRHRPQVVIVDLGLPDGPAAITAARRRHPNVRIAAMAADAAATDAAVRALVAGADGVLLRDAAPETVAAHLLAIASGGTVAPPAAVATLLRRRPADDVLSHLRGADVELWQLIAEGHETAVVARRLCVSERTAKRMVARLLQRLGVANRVQAAALAGRCGVLDGRRLDKEFA